MLTEWGRFTAFRHADFLSINGRHIFKETTELLLFGSYDISSQLMEQSRLETDQNVPLKITTSLAGCSQSCLLINFDLIDTFDGTQLVSFTSRTVLTDSATRKSVRVPRWFRDAFSEYLDNDVPMPVYQTRPLPPVTFSRAYRVRELDIDSNDHVNNKVYMRECLRCVEEVALVGSLAALRAADGGDWLKRITYAEVYHAHECHDGDNLVVHSWQQHPDVLQFQIHRRGVAVYHCNFRFSLSATLHAKL